MTTHLAHHLFLLGTSVPHMSQVRTSSLLLLLAVGRNDTDAHCTQYDSGMAASPPPLCETRRRRMRPPQCSHAHLNCLLRTSVWPLTGPEYAGRRHRWHHMTGVLVWRLFPSPPVTTTYAAFRADPHMHTSSLRARGEKHGAVLNAAGTCIAVWRSPPDSSPGAGGEADGGGACMAAARTPSPGFMGDHPPAKRPGGKAPPRCSGRRTR